MAKVVLVLALLLNMQAWANEKSVAKVIKLSNKGAKIAKILCDADKMPKEEGTIEQLMQKIEKSKACKNLFRSKLEAVAYYVSNGEMKNSSERMVVPSDTKCPVCGMFVAKYPKWAALIEVEGKKYYFDGVKDMMKFYIFDVDFPYDRTRITKIEVTDFYTLDAIDGTKAYYVYDSEIYGPMGRELIPFRSKKAAESFMSEHRGKQILIFAEITPKLVMALDGIDFTASALD